MKRNSDSLALDKKVQPLFGECIDRSDWSEKMTSLMDFAAQSCSAEKHRDSFLVFMQGDLDQPQKDVVLIWFSRHFDPDAMIPEDKKDPRDHEALLCKCFPKHNMTIEKLYGRWKIIVSTPKRGESVTKTVVVTPSRDLL